MQRLTPYGMSNFESIILENRYFIDKTQYIEKLEKVKYPIFLRPRRFGKTLFTDILRWYYDIKIPHKFDELFGNLYIGKNPTPKHNCYFYLRLNFSGMSAWSESSKDFIKMQFDSHNLIAITSFLGYYKDYFGVNDEYIHYFDSKYKNDSAGALSKIIGLVDDVSGKMFIAIDEYDSLTNAMAVYYRDTPDEENEYLNILKKGGFFRAFFETIKHGTTTAVDQVYITGILPITIADMNSGFNIATWITFDTDFDNLLGITNNEFDLLLDQVYSDYSITVVSKADVKTMARNYYNGYHFLPDSENVFNPMMTMFLVNSLIRNRLPDDMVDNNLRIDYNQISYIFGNNNEKRDEVITTITKTKQYDQQSSLNVSFDMNAYKEGKYISEGLYYSGILTYSDYSSVLKIPNLVTYEFVLNYFNRIMNYNTDGHYIGKIVSDYVKFGDVESLIDRFFKQTVQKYPGDFFKNANESFYHGLFFYILWNCFPKNRYEVLPEYQLVHGQVDVMLRSLDGAKVMSQLHDLFEIKCLPKSASNEALKAKLQTGIDKMKQYRTGEYANWRGIVVAFRGNKDYLIEIIDS